MNGRGLNKGFIDVKSINNFTLFHIVRFIYEGFILSGLFVDFANLFIKVYIVHY